MTVWVDNLLCIHTRGAWRAKMKWEKMDDLIFRRCNEICCVPTLSLLSESFRNKTRFSQNRQLSERLICIVVKSHLSLCVHELWHRKKWKTLLLPAAASCYFSKAVKEISPPCGNTGIYLEKCRIWQLSSSLFHLANLQQEAFLASFLVWTEPGSDGCELFLKATEEKQEVAVSLATVD